MSYSPETMGAVCAVVYLLTLIIFIPFPFYQDIVAATSGGGNRDVIVERQPLADGRVLHRFPHSKVLPRKASDASMKPAERRLAGILPFGSPLPPIGRHPGHCRRSFRHPLEA